MRVPAQKNYPDPIPVFCRRNTSLAEREAQNLREAQLILRRALEGKTEEGIPERGVRAGIAHTIDSCALLGATWNNLKGQPFT